VTGVELNDPHVLKSKMITTDFLSLSLCDKERAYSAARRKGKSPLLVPTKINMTIFLLELIF
jgi:hypothetical protein